MAERLLEHVTKGGKLPVYNPQINDAKLIAADRILEGIRNNDNSAVTAFKSHLGCRFGEAIHTTGDDFIFAFAQLSAFQVQNEWEAADRTWDQAIETETVSSFETPKSYGINPVVEGFERPVTEPGKPGHIVPRIPEGSPYPSFTFSGEVAESNALGKAGGVYGLSFEQIINDVAGIVPMIPRLINESLLEREEFDAWQGLIDFIDVPANHLTAQTNLDGTEVPADAPISYPALAAALSQARNREIQGRKVQVTSYNIIVPVGQADVARFYLNNFAVDGATDGSLNVSFPGYNPLSGIAGIVETEYLTGTQWGLIPAKGAIRGNKKFYRLGQLAGNIGPELRLQNVTGQYLGGGAVPPFAGSFATDSAAFRGRIIGGGLGWHNEYAVLSDGDGVLTP